VIATNRRFEIRRPEGRLFSSKKHKRFDSCEIKERPFLHQAGHSTIWMARMGKTKPVRQKGRVQRTLLTEYHVVSNGRRWDVERDAMFTGSFAYDVLTAVGLATTAAMSDQQSGLDVMVCVQQSDGSCRKIWP
jgi:hypothetical protein